MKFSSEKVFDGFSCCFRQWRAEGTHCKFLHGYGISFKVTFEGELDDRNWVFDFGGMKRAKTLIGGRTPDAWMKFMFDHTVIVSDDDPYLNELGKLSEDGVIQLRILKDVGAEKFAEYIFHTLNNFIKVENSGRVRVTKVEFREHNKNSATYQE